MVAPCPRAATPCLDVSRTPRSGAATLWSREATVRPGAATSRLGVVIVVVVDIIVNISVTPVAHLHPEHRQYLEQTETATDQQVDRDVWLHRTVFQVLYTYTNMK